MRLAALLLLAAIAPAAAAMPQAAPLAAPACRWTGVPTQGGLISGTAPAGSVSVTLDGQPVELTDGRFIAGFDRDAAPQAMLVATLADGRRISQTLSVAPRAWRIERLDRLAKFPAPDPVMARLRPPELARIVAARARVTDAEGWRQTFRWPATGRISGLFGAQRIYRGEPGSYHSGIDIAKPTGAPVTAPADGVVILAANQPFTLEGHLLMLDHGHGLNSAFLHLSRIDVRVGDHVRQGEPIGLVGATGRATGPHLHWSLRWHDARLDPLLVAGPMPGA
ncbi:M23 family metallopeptidase [Sphingomonas sp. CV7422]|uniref:M23 family metallopeptidase n=1 Tax=Sphingomonas sp. CV7422 TaxID=3018036 RepID=UPI0022FEBBE8|nr:M23 family metallopeptidase [Sphingomonas sp. CV7422]